MEVLRKYGTEAKVLFPLIDRGTLDLVASVTIAAGDATTDRSDEAAFSQPTPGLGLIEQGSFSSGNFLFRNVHRSGGLGPLFHNVTCQGCHLRDGRGHPPADAAEPMTTMFLRLRDGGVHRFAQHHKRLHFGLGPHTEAERVTVHWPSGIVQHLDRQAADQVLRIVEPEK